GGDDLGDFMRGYLADNGFQGTATLVLDAACPALPEDLPIWLIGLQIGDYGSLDGAEAVVFDDERADMIVESGVFSAYRDVPVPSDAFQPFGDPPAVTGRVFQIADESFCDGTGVYYRLELPQGRYVLAVDLVLDSRLISDATSPTADEYLAFVMEDLLYLSVSGVLDRGNAALQ
ncbi:MAG: hypothetical protein GYB65_20500, partial [Chloroflexi bacterium]|nr:hypothetical protein [Chloroflexota bacterium]